MDITTINKNPFPISRRKRWITFILLLSFNLTLNLDQGTLSGTTSDLKKTLNMEDQELGLFGGMVFLGSTIGCVITTLLINKIDRRKFLICTSILDLISLISITTVKIKLILYFCRFISGFCVSFISIYVPVWSDQFGIYNKKSMMMTLIHLTSTLGYLIGYVLGMLISWNNTFYLQNLVLIFQTFFLFFFIDNTLFSITILTLKVKVKKEEKYDSLKNEEINDSNARDINNNENNFDEISLFEDIYEENLNMDNKDLINKNIKESILVQVKECLKSKLFISVNICVCIIYIILSGIQFWIDDYMNETLKIENKSERLIIFIIIIVSSPITGLIFGGIITTKIGGYNNKRSIYVPFYAAIVVIIFSNLILLTWNKYLFTIFFWFFLFSGGIILPCANGIILCSVNKIYAGIASSLNNFSINIFGRFIGPVIYGYVKKLTFSYNTKFAMGVLLNISFIAFTSILFSIKFSNDMYNNRNNDSFHLTEENKEIEMS